MSDSPVAARSSAGAVRAVSLLSRIILPRPGEPLDVRKLYIEESNTNARRAHAATRTTLEIGAESEVSFATYFNASRPATGGAGPSLRLRGAARRAHRHRPRRRLPLQGHRSANHVEGRAFQRRRGRAGASSSSRSTWRRSRTAAGSGSTSPPTPRSRCTARAGTRRCRRPAGPTSRSASRPSTGPTDCVNALAALTSDPLVDEVISAVIVPDQGTNKAARPSGLRRGGRAAGRPAADPRPAQPRRLRRLQPGDVRGAEEHRLRTDPVHGRRHPHRAGLDPAGAGDEPVRRRRRRSSAARCSTCRSRRTCTSWARWSTTTNFMWTNAPTPSTTTTSPSTRSTTKRSRAASCCTAASTSTTTAGGCA